MGKQKIIKLNEELIIDCRECGLVMYTVSGTLQDKTNLCYPCRKVWMKEKSRRYRENMSPEECDLLREKSRIYAIKKYKKNKEYFRQKALKYYYLKKKKEKEKGG